ncbi:MAG: thioredoxin family protein [Candidatus Hadarchaeota archaeon]|nr:thioredoxin family protein [Candidatus Hadarchaeota archaeon]
MGELDEIRKRKIEELKEKHLKKSRTPATPIQVTDKTFDSAIRKHPAVVTYCWGEWCPPCDIIEPIINQLANDYSGRVVFGKLNTNQNKNIAIKYQVMTVPTLLFFKNGKLIDRAMGAVPREQIERKLKKIIR